jgi:lycopene beta-cyclase
MPKKYDIIICGGGLAGLSLAYRAFKSGIWKDQQVLIIDKTEKTSNDRTWSFWEKAPGAFEHLVHHQWKQLIFYTNQKERIALDHLPYTYKTIKGLDFYDHVCKYLRNVATVDWLEDSVISTESIGNHCLIKTTKASFECTFAFNSLFEKPILKNKEQYFLQHFKGVRIRTKEVKFNSDEAFLMDFRTSQKNGTTFFYTLPMSENEVFVEYTLFSKELLDQQVYDNEIKAYLSGVLKITDYELLETEFGVIPMTDYHFNRRTGNIMNIGTAGGDTRGSTGYTFSNVQKTISNILHAFKQTRTPFFKSESLGVKEKLYDATLLNVLAERKYEGHQLFGDLFRGTKAKTVFAFLDGEGNLLEEIQVMKSLKTWPFLKWFVTIVSRKL